MEMLVDDTLFSFGFRVDIKIDEIE